MSNTVSPLVTTLAAIRACDPCTKGWSKLLRYLGKTKTDDAPISIATIVESNGLDDALWCLRAVKNHDREIRLYAVWCARQVQHLMTDARSINALDVAERFANSLATLHDLAAAGSSAVTAAVTAAGSSAWAAAGSSAWAAAGSSAWAAAWAAALDAARAAAWEAAWDAGRATQKTELLRVCAALDAGIDPYPYRAKEAA